MIMRSLIFKKLEHLKLEPLFRQEAEPASILAKHYGISKLWRC